MKLSITAMAILFLLLCGLAYSMAMDVKTERKVQAKINMRADMAYPMAQRNEMRITHNDELWTLGKVKRGK